MNFIYSVSIGLEKSDRISFISLYPNYSAFSFMRNPFDGLLSSLLCGLKAVRIIEREPVEPIPPSPAVHEEILL